MTDRRERTHVFLREVRRALFTVSNGLSVWADGEADARAAEVARIARRIVVALAELCLVFTGTPIVPGDARTLRPTNRPPFTPK